MWSSLAAHPRSENINDGRRIGGDEAVNNYRGTALDTILVHGCVECVVIDRYTYTVLVLAIA